jgi:Glyoxalase-like domain
VSAAVTVGRGGGVAGTGETCDRRAGRATRCAPDPSAGSATSPLPPLRVAVRPAARSRRQARRKGASVHRSRLVGFVIDCKDGDLDRASAFWSAALGRRVRSTEGNYVTLERRPGEPAALLQKVDHPSRVHLDIESDDVEAEVRRLEALGATRVRQVETWWVMEAPTGHRFCVVRPQLGPLGDDANSW